MSKRICVLCLALSRTKRPAVYMLTDSDGLMEMAFPVCAEHAKVANERGMLTAIKQEA